MGNFVLWIGLWLGVMGFAINSQDIEHRPGALFVRRGTVSLTGSVYRVLIHLQPYFFDAELVAMKNFINSSSTLAKEAKQRLNQSGLKPDTQERFLGVVQTFEIQTQRAATALSELTAKNSLLKEFYPTPDQKAHASGPHSLSRPFRQESIANLFGLASYGQIRDLQEWASSAVDTEEKILHAVDQQFTFINKNSR